MKKICAALKSSTLVGVLGFSLALGGRSLGQKTFKIDKGFDLLNTKKAEFDFGGKFGLNKIKFKGKDLKKFDFGKGAKPKKKKTGDANIIIKRDPAVVVGGPGETTIDIELVALSLVSVNPIDIGGGPEKLLLSNPIDKGSTATIHFESAQRGTFNSKLKFDITLKGKKSKKKLKLPTIKLSSSNSLWNKKPPANALIIPGVNNGPKNPFWPGLITHSGGGSQHIAQTASAVPEPATVVLLATGLVVGLGFSYSRRRKAA